MTTTYEMIRALPAKGFNWAGFTEALLGKVIAADAAQLHTIRGWLAAKGMREVRTAAMEMANFYADKVSKRSNIIAPTSETRTWDSFEGGHHDVWNDAASMETATQEVGDLIRQFKAA